MDGDTDLDIALISDVASDIECDGTSSACEFVEWPDYLLENEGGLSFSIEMLYSASQGSHALVALFTDRDNDGEFPEDFCLALADAGWMGIAMPKEYGGSGLGITEAAIMAQTITESGAGNAGFAAIVIGIFGLNPVVIFGTDKQKQKWLPPIIKRQDIACFAVTEPDTGLDTTRLKTRAKLTGDHYIVDGEKIWTSTAQVSNKMLLIARTNPDTERPIDGLSLFYTDLDRNYCDIRAIDKMGRKCVDSNELFIDGLPIPKTDLIGEEG